MKQTTQDKTGNRMSWSTTRPLPVKFLAIAKELGQRKSQLKRYKDILHTGNW